MGLRGTPFPDVGPDKASILKQLLEKILNPTGALSTHLPGGSGGATSPVAPPTGGGGAPLGRVPSPASAGTSPSPQADSGIFSKILQLLQNPGVQNLAGATASAIKGPRELRAFQRQNALTAERGDIRQSQDLARTKDVREEKRLGLEERRVTELELGGAETRTAAQEAKEAAASEKRFTKAMSTIARRAVLAARKGKDLSIADLNLPPELQNLIVEEDVQGFLEEAKAAIEIEGLGNSQAKLNLEESVIDIAQKRRALAQSLSQSGLSTEQINQSFRLSGQYEQASRTFFNVRDSFNRAAAASDNPTSASDVALIFAFMKMLDPGSVVRESEQTAAREFTRPIPAGLIVLYNRMVTGETMLPEQRAVIMAEVQKLFGVAQSQQQSVNDTFTKRATDIGIPSDLVVRSLRAAGTPSTPKSREIAVGDTATLPSGEKLRWDGKEWVKIP